MSAYQVGAWEFFGQPLDGETVLLKLKTFIESKIVVDALRRDSLIDEATGLYNRRGLLRRARELASDATRRGSALAGVVLAPATPTVAPDDADRWASRIGEVIRAAGRSSDAVGRLAALEFGIVALSGTAAETERMIDRITDAASRWPADASDPPVGLRGAYCFMGEAKQPIDPEHMFAVATTAVHQRSDCPIERAAGS
jgi:GGDEF domain-containing protein